MTFLDLRFRYDTAAYTGQWLVQIARRALQSEQSAGAFAAILTGWLPRWRHCRRDC